MTSSYRLGQKSQKFFRCYFGINDYCIRTLWNYLTFISLERFLDNFLTIVLTIFWQYFEFFSCFFNLASFRHQVHSTLFFQKKYLHIDFWMIFDKPGHSLLVWRGDTTIFRALAIVCTLRRFYVLVKAHGWIIRPKVSENRVIQRYFISFLSSLFAVCRHP